MSKVPHQVADFIALPVIFQCKALSKNVKHYIYLKAYEPKIPDEESPRALFAVNVPVTSTEAQLRHLFTTQLSNTREGGGTGQHIQRIHFATEQDGTSLRSASSSSLIATTTKTAPAETTTTTTALGKRKRKPNAPPTTSDLSSKLTTYHLPSTSPTTFHATGSTAIIVFLDRTARDLALRACRKAARSSHTSPIIWPETATAPLGRARYAARRELTFPSRTDLLRQVDEYMTTYAELEGARAREAAKLRAEPDADGFVTVTRGSRGVVTAEEAQVLKERLEAKRKKKRRGSGGGSEGLDDFYRFQMRERRKEEQGKLLRQFEDDKRKVKEMRSGKVVPES